MGGVCKELGYVPLWPRETKKIRIRGGEFESCEVPLGVNVEMSDSLLKMKMWVPEERSGWSRNLQTFCMYLRTEAMKIYGNTIDGTVPLFLGTEEERS